MTARGCLPPGANVCVAAPANQISSAIRAFVRILDSGVWTNFQGPPLPFLLVPSPSLPLPSHSTPFPLPSLKSSPLKSSCKLHSGVWGWAPPKLNLVHFSLKISHPVATNLKIFLRINWPNFIHNFQILCRIWKCVNSAKHWIAIASKTVTGCSIQFYSKCMISQISSVRFLV